MMTTLVIAELFILNLMAITRASKVSSYVSRVFLGVFGISQDFLRVSRVFRRIPTSFQGILRPFQDISKDFY